MKILAIGDPHGDVKKLEGLPLNGLDLILLTGDLGSANLMRKQAFERVERQSKGLPEKEISPNDKKRAFMEAYRTSLQVVRFLARHAPVATIYGNVESTNPETHAYSREIGLPLPSLTDALCRIPGVRVINNRLMNAQGVRIGGLQYFVDTNWVRDFKPSKYQKRLHDAKISTDKAKSVLSRFKELDILVCHQPPYGHLDTVGNKAPVAWRGKNAGSKTILNYINRHQPRYVFCGHIHEGEGKAKIGKTEIYNLGVGGHKIVEF